jgi:hypothetical protein
MSQNPITNNNPFINHNLTPQATSQKDSGGKYKEGRIGFTRKH